jgi:hypothetical protein
MNDLRNFIDRRRAAVDLTSVDWAKRKDKWLEEINKLFLWIQAQMFEAGVPQTDMTIFNVELKEERLGAYQVPVLNVKLDSQTEIQFRPIASVVVGGFGRIDISNKTGINAVKLIADDESIADEIDGPRYGANWTWRVYPARGIERSYQLDSLGLTRALSSLLG